MPYRRNYRYNRKRTTPKRYTNRNRSNRVKTLVDGKTAEPGFMKVLRTTGSAAAAMYPLAKTVGSVLSMINVEDKYIDNSNSVTAATGTVTLLTGIAQGATDSQRNGNKILLKDMNLNFTVTKNASAAITFVRVTIFMDKECDGVVPTYTDIYNNTGVNGGVNGMLNKDNSDRYTIIKSFRINLDNASQQSVLKKLYVKLPIHVNYDGIGSTITDCKENQIFIMITHNEATNFPSVAYYSRIRYYDN